MKMINIYLKLATVYIISMLLSFPITALGESFDPTARFSTMDQDGDGVFESFEPSVYGSVVNPGLPSNGRIAHVEFNLSGFSGQAVTSAILHFELHTNNAYHQTMPSDDHDRTFEVNIYIGNGLPDLGDAEQTDHITVTTVTYHNVSESGKSFAIDLTPAVLEIYDILDSNSFLGISLVGLPTDGGAWGPSVWFGPGTDRAPILSVETAYPVLDSDGDGILDDVDICPFEDSTGFDADSDGCIDSFLGLLDVLNILVTEGFVDSTMKNSLVSKISNAEDRDSICVAVNELEAFKAQIEAQRGNKISDDAANLLIDYVENIIVSLLAQLSEGNAC